MTRRHTPESWERAQGLGFMADGRSFSHGGAYGTHTTADLTTGLILGWLIQQSTFHSDGATAREAFEKAALAQFGVRPRRVSFLTHFLLSSMLRSTPVIMNVSLGNKWDQFVEGKVRSGDFQTASEVIREGLRLLEKEELLKKLSVASFAELEARLVKAAESLDAGRGVDGEEAFARLRQRSKARRQNG